MDVEVDGILCPVGQVDVVPVALAGGGSFVLLTGHPDGKAGFVQLEPVERLGGFIEAQLLDKDFDAVGTVPEIDGGQTQRHEGQHTGQQSGLMPGVQLGEADPGKDQQNGRKDQRTFPDAVMLKQVEPAETAERCRVHGDRDSNGL